MTLIKQLLNHRCTIGKDSSWCGPHTLHWLKGDWRDSTFRKEICPTPPPPHLKSCPSYQPLPRCPHLGGFDQIREGLLILEIGMFALKRPTQHVTWLTACAFPPTCMVLSCCHVQESSWVDRTNERCTPSERCTAEQSMQRNTPYVTDDQVGFLALQSKQSCVFQIKRT